MRRGIPVLLAVAFMTMACPTESLLDDVERKLYVESSLVITFTNGPTTGEPISSTKTLTFDISGSGTLDSLQLEISDDGVSWSQIHNLTSSPWLIYFDSTQHNNGSYNLRVGGWDSDVSNHTFWTVSESFSIVNQIPIITDFSISSPDYGSGTSSEDRAWFSIPETGTLSFSWSASDDDLSHASLVNVPGSGVVPNDGPGSLNYGWDWSPGDMAEGKYNPRLTVSDYSGFDSSSTLFIGLDRTAPTMNIPTIGNGNLWQNDVNVTFSGVQSSADDGTGSGVAGVKVNFSNSWSTVTSESFTLTMEEGVTVVGLKPIDLVGNEGDEISLSIRVDVTKPEGLGWSVDELTTSNTEPANVTFSAFDIGSGIDESNCRIEYGFDTNGVGTIPDITGSWQNTADSGLNVTVGSNNWATKSRQYLLLRAVLSDTAGNEFTTIPAAYQVLPGLDLEWNLTATNVNRLVVRPGSTSGQVEISSSLVSNQVYGGAVTVRLEAAPADRNADVEWSMIETKLLLAGSFSDMNEEIQWNYSILESGQWDLRLIIDPINAIDERDEGNNAHYMMVTGATVTTDGAVTSFAPGIGILLLVGFVATYWNQRRKRLILLPKSPSHPVKGSSSD